MSEAKHPTALLDLVELMQRLRSPQGCPWDREQTARTLQPYLLEETYEVLEALDHEDPHAIREELGDLLLQVIFLAQIFAEQNLFTIEDVARGITDKLIRRHPHVFSGTSFASMDDLNRQWARIKSGEKKKHPRQASSSPVPLHLPALARAAKLLEPLGGEEEKDPLRTIGAALEDFAEMPQECRERQLAAALACLAALGKSYGIDSEQALRRFLLEHETKKAHADAS